MFTVGFKLSEMETNDKSPKGNNVFRKVNIVLFWVILALAITDTFFGVFIKPKPHVMVVSQAALYGAMLIVLYLLLLLDKFKIDVPWKLSAFIVIFSLLGFIIGGVFDFYGKYKWWDTVLHAVSGVMMSIVAFWLIHVTMAENARLVYQNKWFLFFFLLMFSVGMGVFWEIIEFFYDSIVGTNAQQFMTSTTGSYISSEDIPRCGHDALCDTMWDLTLNFIGALAVAVYALVRHDKIIAIYRRNLHPTVAKNKM